MLWIYVFICDKIFIEISVKFNKNSSKYSQISVIVLGLFVKRGTRFNATSSRSQKRTPTVPDAVLRFYLHLLFILVSRCTKNPNFFGPFLSPQQMICTFFLLLCRKQTSERPSKQTDAPRRADGVLELQHFRLSSADTAIPLPTLQNYARKRQQRVCVLCIWCEGQNHRTHVFLITEE